MTKASGTHWSRYRPVLRSLHGRRPCRSKLRSGTCRPVCTTNWEIREKGTRPQKSFGSSVCFTLQATIQLPRGIWDIFTLTQNGKPLFQNDLPLFWFIIFLVFLAKDEQSKKGRGREKKKQAVITFSEYPWGRYFVMQSNRSPAGGFLPGSVVMVV